MKKFEILFLLLILTPWILRGAGTSSGSTLLRPSGARAAALGEAFSAVSNDVSAMAYNPATLHTLSGHQAAFMYQQGIAEDSFGRISIGSPQKIGHLGLSINYYDGGDFEFFDGTTVNNLDAKTDINITIGYANQMGPISGGLGFKYISSEIVEEEKATAFAVDLGLLYPVNKRLTMSLAAQRVNPFFS